MFRAPGPAVLLACLALSGGCAGVSHDARVEAKAQPGPLRPQAYRLRSGNPALGEESLRYNEAAEFVRTALSGRGWYEVPAEGRTDAIVEVEFGMLPRPPAAQGGPRSGPAGSDRRRGGTPESGSTGPRAMAAREGIPPPDTRIQKYLLVTAREAKPVAEGRPPVELWQVKVTVEDESNDLRKYLPLMASAVVDHLGRDSGGAVAIRMREDGAAVDFIRRGMGGPTPALAEPARR